MNPMFILLIIIGISAIAVILGCSAIFIGKVVYRVIRRLKKSIQYEEEDY